MKTKAFLTKQLLVISFLLLTTNLAQAHFEVVGKLTFQFHDNALFITASFDKMQLANALAKEGECTPKDMMNVCANQYIQDHIELTINGKVVNYTKVNQELQKSTVAITYKVNRVKNIEAIAINSTYMLFYNTHAILKYTFLIDEKIRHYSTDATRMNIQVPFND